MPKDNTTFRCPPCLCGHPRCAMLRKSFHKRNDVLLRDVCQVVSFAKKKEHNGGQGNGGQTKTNKKKRIYEECFGRELEYGVQNHVAFLHFPLLHLEYCRLLREQRRNTNTRTVPSAPVAKSDMVTAGLEEFTVEKFEGKDYYGNSIYFIPPNITVEKVEYGLDLEETLARVHPPQVAVKEVQAEETLGKAINPPLEVQYGPEATLARVDPQGDSPDSFTDGSSIDSGLMAGSLGTYTELSIAKGEDALTQEGTTNPWAHHEDADSDNTVTEKAFSLEAKDLKEGKFEAFWDTWQANQPEESAVTAQVKRNYAKAAIADLQKHKQYLATLQSLSHDAQIAQNFSLSNSFSPNTIEHYRAWRDVRTAADERLLVSLANDIGNSYIDRYDTFQSNATAGRNNRKRKHSATRDNQVLGNVGGQGDMEQDCKRPAVSLASLLAGVTAETNAGMQQNFEPQFVTDDSILVGMDPMPDGPAAVSLLRNHGSRNKASRQDLGHAVAGRNLDSTERSKTRPSWETAYLEQLVAPNVVRATHPSKPSQK